MGCCDAGSEIHDAQAAVTEATGSVDNDAAVIGAAGAHAVHDRLETTGIDGLTVEADFSADAAHKKASIRSTQFK
jgi:hypothetical protein